MQNNAIHPTFQFRSGIPALYRDNIVYNNSVVKHTFSPFDKTP